MSTLQSQLAAISSRAGNYPGLRHSISKKHEESIGRGFQYSVQHGYAPVTDANKFHRASILFSSAREAADVPLSTLEGNSRAAITELTESLGPSAETRILTDHSIFRQDCLSRTINQYLLVLSTLIPQSREMALPCWHIIEFLLRKHDIHVRHMEFVFLLLPCAHIYPEVFHRFLQLIDVASHTSYIWMRPYAAPIGNVNRKRKRGTVDETPSVRNHIPRRSLIAMHVMKHADLIIRICDMARQASSLDCGRSGTLHLINFSAAILVEGMSWLQNQSLLLKETALRAMLGPVSSSCSSSEPALRAWGYVVTSTLADTMEMNSNTLGVLTTKMLSAPGLESENDLGDALTAVIAVVSPRTQTVSSTDSYFLPLLNGRRIGCMRLPASTVQKLFHWPKLADILGHLYENRGVFVDAFMVAIMVAEISDDGGDASLSLSFVQNERLHRLWRNTPKLDLLRSFSAWIVKEKLYHARSLLKAMHDVDSSLCEIGIGEGLSQADGNASEEEMSSLLKGLCSKYAVKEGCSKLLPVRLALTHEDAEVRLESVRSLQGESLMESNFDLMRVLVGQGMEEKDDRVFMVMLDRLSAWVDVLSKTTMPPPYDLLEQLSRILISRADVAATCVDDDSSTSDRIVEVAGMCARILSTEQSEIWFRFVGIILVQFWQGRSQVAVDSFLSAFGQDLPSLSNASKRRKAVGSLLFQSPIKHLLNAWNAKVFSGQFLFKCSMVVLREYPALSVSLDNASSPNVFLLCLLVLKSAKKSESKDLKTCLCSWVENSKLSPQKASDTMVQLSTAAPLSLAEDITIPVLQTVVARFESSIAQLLVVLSTLVESSSRCKRGLLAFAVLDFQESKPSRHWLWLLVVHILGTTIDPKLKSYLSQLLPKIARTAGQEMISTRLAELSQHMSFKSVLTDVITATSESGFADELCFECLSLIDACLQQQEDCFLACCKVSCHTIDLLSTIVPSMYLWKQFGLPVVDFMRDRTTIMPRDLVETLTSLVALLQKPQSNVIISSGPSPSGRRSRSYSVGSETTPVTVDESEPYVVSAIDAIFSVSRSVSDLGVSIVDKVVTSAHFRDHVVGVLPRKKRDKLFAGLVLFIQSYPSIPEQLINDLPLDCADLISLIGAQVSNYQVAASTLLAEFLRIHARRLSCSHHETEKLCFVVVQFMERLKDAMGSPDIDDEKVYQFLSLSLGLLSIFECNSNIFTSPNSETMEFAKQIMNLDSGVVQTRLHRGRIAVLKVLSKLCEGSPKLVLSTVEEVLSKQLKRFDPEHHNEVVMTECWQCLIPSLVAMSLKHEYNLGPFVVASVRAASDADTASRDFLVCSILSSAAGVADCAHRFAFVGSLISCSLVLGLMEVDEVVPLTSECDGMTLLGLILCFLDYSRRLVMNHFDSDGTSASHVHLIVETRLFMALPGSAAMALQFLLKSSKSLLSLASVSQVVKSDTEMHVNLSLQVWNSLLLLRTAVEATEASYHGSGALEATLSVFETFQDLLPVSHFLASMKLLLTSEESTYGLKACAMHLLAQQALRVEDSDEMEILLDGIYPLSTVLELSDSRLILLASMTIEHMARAYLGSEAVRSDPPSGFFSCLDSLMRQLESTTSATAVVSLSLAVNAVLRVTKPKSVRVVPRLFQVLLPVLKNCIKNSDKVSSSLLLSLSGSIEECKGLTGPFLPTILSKDILFHENLRNGSIEAVVDSLEKFETRLCDVIPSRILIPNLCSAIGTCDDMPGLSALLALLCSAVEHVNKKDAAISSRPVSRAGLSIFQKATMLEDSELIVSKTVDLLQILFSSLSEKKLQEFVKELLDWSGTVAVLTSPVHRFVLWRFCCVFSGKFGALFLPSFTLTFENVVKELCHFNELSSLECESDEFGICICLLKCLHSILSADARAGGLWIRANDGRRFEMLREPLCQMLALDCNDRAYSSLVSPSEGVGLVKVLLSLASAAGSVTLWKPLNHSVLEACGSDRVAVRRAGLSCLRELFVSIGDEYMELLPECLPVLAELLEDADPIVATAARDVVGVAENVLGESLEESLR